jgi:hypothetical protein
VTAQFPHAPTWRDLGVATPSSSHTTSSALAALAAYSGGERECCLLVLNLVSSTLPCIRECFVDDKLADSSLETSERSPTPLYSLAEGEEDESANAPAGYTQVMQDPRHHGQMFRSPIKDS